MKENSLNLILIPTQYFQTQDHENKFIVIYDIKLQGIPNLSLEAGTLYTINAEILKLQGNYFVIAYWQNNNSSSIFDMKWRLMGDQSEPVKIALILGILIPCLLVSCCFLCVFTYYRSISKRRVAPEVQYREMNQEERIDGTYVDERLPVAYYLCIEKEVCSICFDK